MLIREYIHIRIVRPSTYSKCCRNHLQQEICPNPVNLRSLAIRPRQKTVVEEEEVEEEVVEEVVVVEEEEVVEAVGNQMEL